VLLVHGITTYSFIWRQIIPKLSLEYKTLAVDLAGCGEADMSPGVDYSLPAHAERLRALLDELGLQRVHLLSHDVGGGIAQIFAVRYPERLLSLTLINPVGYNYWPVQPISAMRAPLLRHLAIAALDLGIYTLLIKRGVFHTERVTPGLMEMFWAPLRARKGRKAFLSFAKSLNNLHLMEIIDQLRGLKTPTLIVRGDEDLYLPASICERLAGDLPNARLLRFSEAGHFIQEDIPILLTQSIIEFFKETCHV